EADTFYDDPSLMVQKDQLSGRTTQYVTVGLRAELVRGLILDLGSDLGLASPGFEYGSPTPPWNLIFGASYSYDPLASHKVTRTITRTVAAPEPPREGRIRGQVRSVQGGRALG